MASSQVEIASSNPFVCILRNQKNIPSQTTTFQKNLKGLVRDRLHTRISVSPDSPPHENPLNHETGANKKNKTDNMSTWIGSRDKGNPPTLTQRQSRAQDMWAALRAREMVSTIDVHNQDEDLVGPPSPTPLQSTSTSQSEPSSPLQPQSPHTPTTPASAPNRGASSLVQIWEARLGRSTSMRNNAAVTTELTAPTVSRSSSSNSSSSSCNFTLMNSERTPSNDELPSQFEPSGQMKLNESRIIEVGIEQPSRPSQKLKIIDREPDPRASNASSSCTEQTSRPSQKEKVVVSEPDPTVSTGSSPCSALTCVPSQKCKITDKESDQTASNESSSCLKLTSSSSQRPKKANKESDQTAALNASSSCSEVTSRPSHRPKTAGDNPDQTTSDDSSSCSEPQQRPKIADLIRRLMAANSTNSKKTTGRVVSELSTSSDTEPDHSQERRSPCTNSNNSQEKAEPHPPHDCGEGSDRAFVPNVNHCPRLRGRQAFNDLLLIMEHDRYSELEVIGERNAVSGFSHKGRIQSILRLKILQRGLSIQDGWCPRSRSTKPNHGAHVSTVHLRDKSTNAEDQADQQKDEDIGSSSCAHSSESSSTTYNTVVDQLQQSNGEKHSDERESVQLNPESSCSVISIPTEDVSEPPDSYSMSYQEWPLDEEEEEEVDEEEEEEEEVNIADGEDTAPERFLGVARPRSYWEDRRKAWYGQMLAAESDDSEIRELLQRRTVSSVLTTEGDFHNRMNNLMKSHVERQIHGIINDDEDDEIGTSSLETMRRFLSSYLQQQGESLQSTTLVDIGEQQQQHVDPEEEEHQLHGQEEDEEDEDDDEDTFLRRQERMEELMSNRLQVHAADSASSHENDDDDDQVIIDEVESINVHQNTSSPSTPSSPLRSNGDARVGVSMDRVSMEMELIIELRGQMKQMYQEMSELRRCMSNCVDVQLKFQDSIKQEMMTVRGGLRTEEGAPRKGYCCICYEMKVNSLLYRCGHMCTCLECAHELQLGSGKCPICRSTILDVVKAYTEM